jgi:hypothetical protein
MYYDVEGKCKAICRSDSAAEVSEVCGKLDGATLAVV